MFKILFLIWMIIGIVLCLLIILISNYKYKTHIDTSFKGIINMIGVIIFWPLQLLLILIHICGNNYK
jgi:hypothetical protein